MNELKKILKSIQKIKKKLTMKDVNSSQANKIFEIESELIEATQKKSTSFSHKP